MLVLYLFTRCHICVLLPHTAIYIAALLCAKISYAVLSLPADGANASLPEIS